ncbi:Flp family type IVb pilin [Azospira restricta]|uniref:Flp family type IVb pilin n=1 Tax=Azospira restricta TaxID=404405 RepID=A0A974PWZ0_9RHOO|nr:Flp family type IVb pilin [Azospira restricta]QRJ62925.1 Flp family type IVb pilin [Azospira restricta]
MRIPDFQHDEEAVTAIEYAFIATLIAVVLIAGFVFAGGALGNLWRALGECVVSLGGSCTLG